MKLLKTYWLGLTLLCLSLFSAMAFWLGDSTVADDGRLLESFAFIPLAWLFLAGGLVSLICAFLWGKKHK
ncbi:DUF3955 domain-containing protein [Vibrio halioticoli]|uniref:DUF3955 domain-containing protein n=1 Tax=Vibrio halioticoli TaxID=71388 RepID=UPI000429A362|nr:DUF3955 domain-containing protein [Vibrio halioticoli]